jgi:hypothetical protein
VHRTPWAIPGCLAPVVDRETYHRVASRRRRGGVYGTWPSRRPCACERYASIIVRIAGALSVLVVAAWFLLFRSVDGGPTAAALTQGFLTVYAIALIVLIWMGVGMARIVRAALRVRREVFGDGATSRENPNP